VRCWAAEEAAVFSSLHAQGREPEPYEDSTQGGVDFLCTDGDVHVEVTSIDSEIAGERSGLSANPKQGEVQSFGFLTPTLWNRILTKTQQASALHLPVLLAITSERPAASLLFGEIGASQALVGEIQLEAPIGDDEAEISESTEYYRSAFITSKGEVGRLTRRIAGLLLVGLYHDQQTVTGVLNPAPNHPFSVYALPNVPFLRIAKWPPEGGTLSTEWVIGDKPRSDFSYECFSPTDEQLRSGMV
jgi:hypothetical protein